MQAIGWKFLESRNLRSVLCFNEGPLEPVSPGKIMKIINDNSFSIREDVGLGLLSPIRNRYIYKFSTRDFLKRFSRTRLMIIEKED